MIARLRRRAVKAQLGALRLIDGLPRVQLEQLVGAQELSLGQPILEDTCMPPFVDGADHDDFTPLMRIAMRLRPRVVLEFGTAYGNTVANLCRVLPDCRVVTVNAPAELQTGQVVTFSLEPDQIGRVYRQHGFAGRVKQLLANTLSIDLAAVLSNAVVDLAIIDACHDTEYVLNDFLKVAPHVRPGGVVLLHDTHPSMHGHLVGSYRACMQLRRRGFDIRYLAGTWWGVWQKEAALAAAG